MSQDIVQIKLITGSEIICTFVEGGHTPEEFRVHSILEMIPLTDPEDLVEVEQYILRPYVTYGEDLKTEVSLNPISVVLVAQPAAAIRDQYILSVNEIQSKLGRSIPAIPLTSDSDTPNNVVSFTSRKQLLTED